MEEVIQVVTCESSGRCKYSGFVLLECLLGTSLADRTDNISRSENLDRLGMNVQRSQTCQAKQDSTNTTNDQNFKKSKS